MKSPAPRTPRRGAQNPGARPRAKRARSVARWAAGALLVIGVFAACSSSNDSSPVAPSGPPGVFITTPFKALACDDVFVVQLTFANAGTNPNPLRPPGTCGSLANCGSVLVSLLET